MGLVKGQSMKVQLLMQIYFNRELIEYMNASIERNRVPYRVDSSMSKIWRDTESGHYILTCWHTYPGYGKFVLWYRSDISDGHRKGDVWLEDLMMFLKKHVAAHKEKNVTTILVTLQDKLTKKINRIEGPIKGIKNSKKTYCRIISH